MHKAIATSPYHLHIPEFAQHKVHRLHDLTHHPFYRPSTSAKYLFRQKYHRHQNPQTYSMPTNQEPHVLLFWHCHALHCLQQHLLWQSPHRHFHPFQFVRHPTSPFHRFVGLTFQFLPTPNLILHFCHCTSNVHHWRYPTYRTHPYSQSTYFDMFH